MKPFLLVIVAIVSLSLTPPGEIVVKHHSYKTYYNPDLREPDSVAWDLTADMVSCAGQVRKDAFHADPAIPGSATPAEYTNSGYDKGHLFSYDDAQCNETDKTECFYMSNMLPQIHPFNAGDWKVLEMKERALALSGPLHIVAGGYGSIGKLKAGENVPAYMWKAILQKHGYTVYIMPNLKTSAGHNSLHWLRPIDKFDLKTIGDEIASPAYQKLLHE